jgi:biotin transport system substrate-specific component
MLTVARSLKAVEVPRIAADIIMVTAFAAATALGAFVRIPLPGTEVPFTLQVYFVLFGALLMGMRRGATSQALYVTAGLAGVPVFIGAAPGLAYLAGPTGGYLIGFIVASVAVAAIAGQGSLPRYILAALAGALTILMLGTLHQAFIVGKGLSLAFMTGFLPFVAVDAAKAVLAAVSAWKLRNYCSFSA